MSEKNVSSSTAHPERFGPYEVLRPLGAGGMGSVYEARGADGDIVAIKSLLADAGGDVASIRALRREVRMVREIRHPHIVRIIDADVTGATPWYAMELVSGPNLSTLLGQDETDESAPTLIDTPAPTIPTPSGDADETRVFKGRGVAGWEQLTRTGLSWIGQIAHALAYIHGEGLVHGDLKPENIIVAGDRAVLVDFGLAARVEGRVTLEGLRRAESSAYTPGYVSPERLRGERLDPRADLYSLGCMIYELVAGRLPFEGTALELIMKHAGEEPEPLSSIVDAVPKPLEELVSRLLAKTPRERSAHALDIVSTLQSIGIPTRLQSGQLPAVKPYMYPPPTVDRSEEVDRLTARVRDLRDMPGTALILGESGVGKSTLALRAIHVARERGYGIALTAGQQAAPGSTERQLQRPFSGVRGVLQEIMDFVRVASPREAQAVLGDEVLFLAPFELGFEPYCDREVPILKDPIGAACRALESILGRMFDGQGLLLVVDELQWLDPASRQAFEYLARHASAHDWVVLGLARSGELEPDARDSAEELADEMFVLQGLSPAGTAEAVAGMLGLSEIPDAVGELVHERSGGNPYYIREFMNLALEQGVLALDGEGRWRGAGGVPLEAALARLPEPDSVLELTERRLAALPEDTLRVARYAAVIGREFPLWILSRATAVEPELFDRCINSLRQKAIIEETPDPAVQRFAHDRLREAIYDGLSLRQRSVTHGEVAQALADDGQDPAMVAWHFEQAGRLEEATSHWVEAAEVAKAQHTQIVAAERLADALRTGARVLDKPRLDELTADRIDALVTAEEHPTALRVADSHLTDIVDPRSRARVLTKVSRARRLTGDNDAALESAEAALRASDPDDDPETWAEALNAKGDAYEVQGAHEQALRAYDEALRVALENDLSTLAAQAENNIALAHYNRTDYSKALQWWERALDRVVKAGDRRRESSFCMNIGNSFTDRGNSQRAIEWYERALEITADLGDEGSAAFIRANMGVAYTNQSAYEKAMSHYAAAERHRRRTGKKGNLGVVLLNQATIRTEQGYYEEAEDLLREALSLLQEAKFRRPEAYARSTYGRMLTHSRRYAEAQKVLEDGLALAREIGEQFVVCMILSGLSWLANYQGEPAEALRHATAAQETAEAIDNESARADADFVMGAALHRAGRVREAMERLRPAYDSFVEQGRLWHQAVAALETALAAYTGGLEEADTWLERGREVLQSLEVGPQSVPRRLLVEAESIMGAASN